MPIGPIMIDLSGLSLSESDYKLIQHPLVGGVILFTRNYESLEQLTDLIYSIRDCRNGPILIAVDHEGGRVQRFKEGFTPLPALNCYGELFDHNVETGLQLAEKGGWLMAIELLTAGIDLSFAPVLDLNLGISKVIGDRSFHSDPEIVTLLGKAFISGMNRAGMRAVGKHFPGHGSVSADSHLELPLDKRKMDEIAAQDLLPFIRLSKAALDGIMTAHIVFNQMDSLPVTFSSFWLQKILREQAGFSGVIFSDDLSMAGAEIIGDYPERATKALNAGCDMILICNHHEGVIAVLDQLGDYHCPQSQKRLLKMCGHFQLTRAELTQSLLWRETVIEIKRLSANSLIN